MCGAWQMFSMSTFAAAGEGDGPLSMLGPAKLPAPERGLLPPTSPDQVAVQAGSQD